MNDTEKGTSASYQSKDFTYLNNSKGYYFKKEII